MKNDKVAKVIELKSLAATWTKTAQEYLEVEGVAQAAYEALSDDDRQVVDEELEALERRASYEGAFEDDLNQDTAVEGDLPLDPLHDVAADFYRCCHTHNPVDSIAYMVSVMKARGAK